MIHYIKMKTKVITRGEDGKKIIGAFPNWKNKASHKKVESFSDIDTDRASAIIVGASGLKVIDVDDNDLFDELMNIDSQLSDKYKCKLIVKSDKQGGHFYYNDDANKLDEYLNNPQDGAKLGKVDYQTGNRLIFTWLNNETKKLVTDMPKTPEQLTAIPDTIANSIIAYDYKNRLATLTATKKVEVSDTTVQLNHLAPLALNFLSAVARPDIKLNSLNTFLQIVTPKQYKSVLKEQDGINYHPNTFPEGGGAHNYLVSIGGVLMKDESVDTTLYAAIINYINGLMDSPDNTIKAMIDRDIVSENFRYNSQWKIKTLTLTGKDGSTAYKIYQVLDPNTETYMFVDEVQQKVVIGKKAAIVGIIHSKMAGGRQIKTSNIAEKCLNVRLINDPLKPFGLVADTDEFNIFRRTKVQEIFYEPQLYPELANTEPTITLRYLEHILGGARKRDMFLGFLKRKLSSHDYSPLVFVLWGVPGSGKNTLTQKILAPLVEGRDITNLTVDNLKDKFNSVFKERDFLVLDEVHTLPPQQKRDFINMINAISGKEKIAERKMYSADINSFSNQLTFILTTNKPTELTTEANDRRIVVFRSSTTLSNALGMRDDYIIEALDNEKYAFAYYLSNYKDVDYDIYVKNYIWNAGDIDYEEFMTEAKPLGYQIYKALQTRNYDTLIDILFDVDITDEEFASMITKERDSWVLRVLNSKPDRAIVPSLGNHPNLVLKQENITHELRQLAKEYKTNFVAVEKIEYDNSISTGSRKTTYRIDITKLPQKIQSLVNNRSSNEKVY